MSEGLSEYRKKRKFGKTPEPEGGEAEEGNFFVVQKHEASSLHYDFRIQIEGVLKSWAIPKGPSMKPSVKRLAIETEDHPVEYGDFEGVIPEGEYGAGVVQIWDRGTYENLKTEDGEEVPIEESYEQGQVEVRLEGEKLRGGFALVKTGGSDDDKWLLIKMRDDEADPDREPVDDMPKSAVSDRTIEEIAEDEESD